ncbi:MAG: aminotransferase class I/II-fold pyridoxal phosphate-dependent enzyme [Ginsengibacter sp.]
MPEIGSSFKTIENKTSVSQRLNGIEEYYFSKKLAAIEQMNRTGEEVINLGIGSPDMAPHPEVIQILQEAASNKNNHAYQSYKGSIVLREAVAKWYKKWYQVDLDPAKEILPLAGSKEGIMHICMTYLDAGDGVLVPDPGYPTYRSAALLAGAKVYTYTLNKNNGWLPDLDALEEMDLSSIKLMFVNYPHMPTGALPTEQFFEKLILFAKKHNILICHDNPYSFILNKKPVSLLAFDKGKDVVLELNSLSKSHNMAGWRVGFLCGNAERISNVLRFKSNMDSGMFLPVQLAAAKALSLDQQWFDDLNKIYSQRQKKAFKLLTNLNCELEKEQSGLFVWAQIPSQFNDAFEFTDEILNDCRVFITPGGIFGNAGNRFVRVSLCKEEKIFSEAIKKCKNFVQ